MRGTSSGMLKGVACFFEAGCGMSRDEGALVSVVGLFPDSDVSSRSR